MTAATVEYARPLEVQPWEDDRPHSAYVVRFDNKRTISLHNAPFSYKFYLYNGDDTTDNLVENGLEVKFFQVKKMDAKLLKDGKRDVQREAAQDEVRIFANYMDDWDGYGAIRPLSECLNHALEIIRNKNISLDYLSDIYPNPNGTLSLEWEKNDNEIGLEVGKEEFSYFAHFGEYHSYNNRKQYAAEEIERLAEFVSYLR